MKQILLYEFNSILKQLNNSEHKISNVWACLRWDEYLEEDIQGMRKSRHIQDKICTEGTTNCNTQPGTSKINFLVWKRKKKKHKKPTELARGHSSLYNRLKP